MAALTFILCLPVFWSNYQSFGSPFKTPYTIHVPPKGNIATASDQDFGAYSLKRIPNAAYGMFVSPNLAGVKDGNRGFFGKGFWLLLSLAAPFSLTMVPKRERLFLLILFGFMVAEALFYLSFRASGPGAVKFGTLHYFKMFWPVMVLLATIGGLNLLRLAGLKFGAAKST